MSDTLRAKWTVSHHEDGYLISGPMGSAIIKRTGVQDNDVIGGLLGSLAATEPVQAAGDTAGKKDLSFAHKIGFSTGQTVLLHMLRHRINAALERLYQETPPNFDDSLTGINAAWDAVRSVLAAMDAPAETSDQGQGSGTPTNTETAEKPKPVSLVEAFESHPDRMRYFGSSGWTDPIAVRWAFYWILRTLDQERGM